VVASLVGHGNPYGVEEIFWLANAPVDHLQSCAGGVYKAIKQAGHDAFIPADNRLMVSRSSVL
jgi:hypothetical protein